MNTPSAPARTDESIPALFRSSVGFGPKDEALYALERALEEERDARRSERFYWFCGVLLVADFLTFPMASNFWAPIAISILEFFIIIAFGRTCGIDCIYTLTEKLISRWDGKIGANSQ
jgi:hypothetical protein